MSNKQTGRKIEKERARTLSDALRINTTVQSLNLEGKQDKSEEGRQVSSIANHKSQQTENKLGDEGAQALSDILMVNTTHQSLNLSCGHGEDAVLEPRFTNNNNTNKQQTRSGMEVHEH